jgi:hypothetical protein
MCCWEHPQYNLEYEASTYGKPTKARHWTAEGYAKFILLADYEKGTWFMASQWTVILSIYGDSVTRSHLHQGAEEDIWSQEGEENCIMKSFMICTLCQV